MTFVMRHRGPIALAVLAASTAMIALAVRPSSNERTLQTHRQQTEVHSLLPIKSQEISAAAGLARRFVTTFGTYRFDESPEIYLGRLLPLLGEPLQADMSRNVRNQQLIQQRTHGRVVATADAQVRAIRSLAVGSIVFIVRGHQHIVHATGESDDTTHFDVTVTKDSAGWLVYAIQPSSSGQPGDGPP